ncbi:MAG: hypothetical protein ACHQ52_00320 [Candidatus Eisenbacteria bacterium]
MSDPGAIARAAREALAHPRDLPLAAALPSPMQLAIVVGSDHALAEALSPLLDALDRAGRTRSRVDVLLASGFDGEARLATRERLREALAPVRVHAHDDRRGDTFVAAWLDGEPVRLDDTLRECEGLVLVLAARPGATGATLAGETLAALADADTRARVRGHERPLADAMAIDLALVVDVASTRAWAGTGRWLVAERF